jgi:hypothetical protein
MEGPHKKLCRVLSSCVDPPCLLLAGGGVLQVRKVSVRKYSKVGRSAFHLNGKKKIAILRASGAILGEWADRGGAGGGRGCC